MAKNFRIDTRNSGKQSLSLQLYGDFDGSSAWDLLQVLQKYARKYARVAIKTDQLRNVNSIGFKIVASKLVRLTAAGTQIIFTGKYESAFSGG
ncbi:MAG: hypothetical protein RBT11_16145 [Desulfobacterales bacterium]|jgi:anti-anti-sigma regulatory factor|nr:hypothetical protein [Desulfobacterales bacterium]